MKSYGIPFIIIITIEDGRFDLTLFHLFSIGCSYTNVENVFINLGLNIRVHNIMLGFNIATI
tara:strand:+ start:220 stop:405 length:186 start_codon:yes stop_codon:yes gene_type:complete